jgi:AP2 domain
MHHIHRIDVERTSTHAWRVQVVRRSRMVIRYFSDGVFGGKRAALRAAIVFRDALLLALHDARYELWRRNRKRRNNTSGIVGVGRYWARERLRSGRLSERAYWQAFADDGRGARKSRKFSVKMYGEERAKRLAIAARRAMLAR